MCPDVCKYFIIYFFTGLAFILKYHVLQKTLAAGKGGIKKIAGQLKKTGCLKFKKQQLYERGNYEKI